MALTRRGAIACVLAPMAPAAATPQAMAQAIAAFSAGAPVQDGPVSIEVAELVENGNTVPVTLSVRSPMTESDHVRSLALFTERNPQPEVAVFHFSPRSGVARVGTRIRLATSQSMVAVAKLNDGRCWQRRVDVLVTLAACVE